MLSDTERALQQVLQLLRKFDMFFYHKIKRVEISLYV